MDAELEEKSTNIKTLEMKIDKINKDFNNQLNEKEKIIKDLENNIENEISQKKEQIKINQELTENGYG